jgi:hypothetical protein
MISGETNVLGKHQTVGLLMDDPLATYLHDRLAGANLAIELLENLKQSHSDRGTGAIAASILAEVQADKKVLEGILERVGTGHLDAKDALACLGEKRAE